SLPAFCAANAWLLLILVTPRVSNRSAEARLEALLELLPREAVVLRTVLLDLDCAHQARDPAGRLPIQAVQQPVEEPRAIGVTAAGRVLDRIRPRGRDRVFRALRVDHGALRAARDAQRLCPGRHVSDVPACAILQELPLVVVHDDPCR